MRSPFNTEDPRLNSPMGIQIAVDVICLKAPFPNKRATPASEINAHALLGLCVLRLKLLPGGDI